MNYLWIGIGGALGSMARAWLAMAVADITGPRFPWGTILINILGSFIIGFFGTLTASDSRFALPADARAFVMVGICGGFTTFSSFSLQTLELARDGRAAQALGNIALSLTFCLLAVTAGYLGAHAIRAEHKQAAAAGGAGMGEVVVAVLNEPHHAEALLDAGTCLLELGGGGHLKALAVRTPPAAAILPSEEVLTASREEAIRADQEHWIDQLRAVTTRWTEFAKRRGVRTDWIEDEGDTAAIVADHARRADAVVVPLPGPRESERMHDALHAALFDSGTPVLVVPAGFPGSLGRNVAIAWKPDGRADKAIRAAMPLLRQAQQVYVLCAVRPPVMPAVLTEHDIPATVVKVEDGPGSVGDRLLRKAHDLQADTLVMGAFAHGEWRERLFGGVTRAVLAKADLPVLMRH